MVVARRVFLCVAAAGSAVWVTILRQTNPEASSRLPSEVFIAEFDDAGRPLGIRTRPTVRKTDNEWRRSLALDQYTVTRKGDTELAYAGEYWNFHCDGLYRCVCCGTAIFDSATKFGSGTGWPSFYAPVARGNVVESPDRSWGMARTAVSCRRCGAHLGHVFDDGPAPTHLRYCVNSVALRFVSRAT